MWRAMMLSAVLAGCGDGAGPESLSQALAPGRVPPVQTRPSRYATRAAVERDWGSACGEEALPARDAARLCDAAQAVFAPACRAGFPQATKGEPAPTVTSSTQCESGAHYVYDSADQVLLEWWWVGG